MSGGRLPRQSIRYALLAAIALAAFGSAIGGEFLSDDLSLSTADGDLLATVTRRFWEAEGAARGSELYRHAYRPLLQLVYALETRLFGPVAAAFHAANFVVHALNSCLVLRFLERRLGEESRARSWAAWLGALLFALHPLHAESVSWISGATDLWMLLCGLLALELLSVTSGLRLVLGGCALFCAVLAKEPALVLPVMWFADEWAHGRALRSRASAVVCGAALAGALVLFLVGWGGAGPSVPLQPVSALSLLGFYALKSLLPLQLTFQWRPFVGAELETRGLCLWVGGLLVACVVVLAFRAWRRPQLRPWVADLAWFVVPLLPAVLLLDIVSDRFAYVPVLGVCALVARGWSQLFASERRVLVQVAGVCAGGVLATGFLLSVRSSRCFASEETLWRCEVQAYPRFAPARASLGDALASEQRFGEARGEFAQAVQLARAAGVRADLVEASLRLALLDATALPEWDPRQEQVRAVCDGLLRAGQLSVPGASGAALTLSKDEVARFSNDIDRVLVPCARALLASQDAKGARQLCEHALSLQPSNAGALEVLALSLSRLGKFVEARAALARVSSSQAAERLRGLGERIIAAQGMVEHAQPADARAAALLRAQIFMTLGSPVAARRALTSALSAAPADHELVHMLAQTYVAERRFHEAAQSIDHAGKLAPGDPFWSQALSALLDAELQAKRAP